jgi:LacI family transcriptional regulator
LVLPAVTNPFLARTALAIEERAHELGYDLILAHSSNNEQREEACLRRLLSRRVDGLFISPVYRLAPDPGIYREIGKCATPTVLLGHCAPFCASFSSVAAEDAAGSYIATRHLLSLGHRRIAFLMGPSGNPWAQHRFEGYRRALRESLLEVDDRLVFRTGTGIEDGERAAAQLLQEAPFATAAHATNDLVAIGAADEFLRRGLNIPEDLSIVGFGNIPLSAHCRVPLTTIHQPQSRLGLAAMETMMKLLKGGQPESKLLPVELVRRASSGPAKNGC